MECFLCSVRCLSVFHPFFSDHFLSHHHFSFSSFLPLFLSFSFAIVQQQQTQEEAEDMLRRCYEPGLKKVRMEEKGGWGVVAEKTFHKGEFVCEYSGDLIDKAEAKRREALYNAVT